VNAGVGVAVERGVGLGVETVGSQSGHSIVTLDRL
jgi:hypothetical protein